MSNVPAPAVLSPPPAALPAVAALAATNLTVAYRERAIIRDVTLSIGPGERVALVGPNGAGKSTLLRAITGALTPRTGTLLLGGRAIGSLDRRTVARTIAVVPELVTLPFEMTVDEVVSLGRLPHDPPLAGKSVV